MEKTYFFLKYSCCAKDSEAGVMGRRWHAGRRRDQTRDVFRERETDATTGIIHVFSEEHNATESP